MTATLTPQPTIGISESHDFLNMGEDILSFAEKVGVTLDTESEWRGKTLFNSLSQAELLARSVHTTEDEELRYSTVFDAESRQNGKGVPAMIRCLYGAAILGEKVLWNAHELATSEEHFERHRELVETTELQFLVKSIRTGNGKLMIRFKNDGVIYYRARTKGGGRGLTKISLIIYDEAQAITAEQIAASAPAMAAAEYTQKWFSGSPGLRTSVDWWALRKTGLLQLDPHMLFSEHTAQRVEVTPSGELEFIDPDPADRSLWAQANPGLVHGRIKMAFLESQFNLFREKLHLFAREHLGVWQPPPNMAQGGARKISPDTWKGLLDPASSIPGHLVIAVAADFEQQSASICAGGWRNDHVAHVELIDHGKGVAWVGPRMEHLLRTQRPQYIGLDMSGSAAVLEDEVIRICAERKIQLFRFSAKKMSNACEGLKTKADNNQVAHLGDQETISSLDGIQIVGYGKDGGWRWLEESEHVTSPMVAATMAVQLTDRLSKRRSAYEDYDEELDSHDETEEE